MVPKPPHLHFRHLKPMGCTSLSGSVLWTPTPNSRSPSLKTILLAPSFTPILKYKAAMSALGHQTGLDTGWCHVWESGRVTACS